MDNNLSEVIKKKTSYLLYISIFFLVFACLIAALNMSLRPFGFPIPAAYEIISFCIGISLALSLPDSFIRGNHIYVDILLKKLNHKLEKVFIIIGKLIVLVFFVLIFYYLTLDSIETIRNNELSEGLKIPLYIPKLFVLTGIFAFIITLVFLIISPPKK